MPKIPFPKKRVSKPIAAEELAILEHTYPQAVTALHYSNPFELLIAVILSAQCTDARVNMTTPTLFRKYPTAQSLAKANQSDVERIVKSCGFFRMKAKNIINAARCLVERHAGEVPQAREDLEALSGVGRKTASVVMSVAFGEAAIAVDTHVFRVAHRLGLTVGKTPRDVERDLEGEWQFDPSAAVPSLINLSKISTEAGYGEALTPSSLLKLIADDAELEPPAHLQGPGPLSF